MLLLLLVSAACSVVEGKVESQQIQVNKVVVNVKKKSCGQLELFLTLLVSLGKQTLFEVSGKIFLVSRLILKVKECSVISF